MYETSIEGLDFKNGNNDAKEVVAAKNDMPSSSELLLNPDPKQADAEPRQVWFCEMFRFATKFDIALMTIGSIAALAMGVALPSFSYIWGKMTNAFAQQDMVSAAKDTLLIQVYIGVGAFFAGWLMFACWMITGQRQGISCRKAYLRSLLRQEIGWFDMINQAELASKFAKDTFAFQGAIGQKISTLIMTIGTLIAGFVFAFISGWLMTLVLLATLPIMAIAGGLFMKAIGEKDKNNQAAYSKAGGLAEQALSSIKTVKQLNGQGFEAVKYGQCLEAAVKKSMKFSVFSSLAVSVLFFCMLASYAFGFWYGSRCVLETQDCPREISRQSYTAGDVLVVFFSILMSGFNLSQLTPAFQKITEGRQAASRIFQVIDRQPLITNPPNGLKPKDIKGVIKFENVTFAYPRDPARIIFKNINLEFDIKKTGLVGQSGCGKSTALQLIMRFYDPDEGRVTLDGYDLRTLDLIWLRQQIGYVGQEPVLFATTIKENLQFGSQDATDEEIKAALKMAEAYDFVQGLEQKLETYVGFGGGQLSGGQKQRIAIARAILRKPKIMLLDEATSALDRRNQKLIQTTLQKVTEGITTITVAHRVKTIMNSDIIYVLDKGGVKEKGKFRELKMFENHHYQIEHEQEQKKQAEAQKKSAPQTSIESIKLQANKQKLTKQQQEEKQKQQTKRLVEKYEKSIFGRLFAYSKDQILFFIVGIIVSLANGVIYPAFSIFLSEMLEALLLVKIDSSKKKTIQFAALMFLIFAICSLVLTFIQMLFFERVGSSITRKIRLETYSKMLKMPVSWFDIPKNNAGTLTARLSTDCQVVNSMTTTVVQIMIQNLSTLISGLVVAFNYEWRTALVALGLLPLMIIAGGIQMSISTGFSDKTDAAYKDSSSLIMEAMTNIRTVSSFGYEGIIAKRYDEKMEEPYELAVKKGNLSGLFFGLSQLIMFIIFGVLFYLGAIFVRDNPNEVTVTKMFTAVYAIMFAGMTAGNNSHFMPDTAACKNSAANLFQILDSEDEDQLQLKEQSKMLKSGVETGDIELENVSFKYQSRNEYVFKNLSLKIKNGTKVAFVGSSGCGKSTIIQLLQRFYEPILTPNQGNQDQASNQIILDSKTKGSIKINGVDIKDYDLHYLRKSFGVVSQEPVLFNGSFKQNILYNIPEDELSQARIMEAAEKANALSFILNSQQQSPTKVQPAKGSTIKEQQSQSSEEEENNKNKTGFDRSVGIKGSHISGGQKQRVAIARTILREPSKLLLDEATSALDRANEIRVQESLDKIMIGKTVISIAHRIETIKNSDTIFVFDKGQIVESGSYSELVAKKGYFYSLERGTQFT